MRNAIPSLVLVLLAALSAITASRGSGAACAAGLPGLEASPAQAAPDERFGLRGEGFYGDFVCDDTGPTALSRPAGGRPTDGIGSSSCRARGRGPWRPSPATGT